MPMKFPTRDPSVRLLASTAPECRGKAGPGQAHQKQQVRSAMNSSPDLLQMTVKEVAELCRVHTKTVRNWIKDEEIAALRKGRLIRISLEALQAFLKKHER